MGIAGELVRSVFTKRQSTKICETNGKSNAVDKRRWSSVRAYLCGNEIMSVGGEQDSLSVKSSEATVTQPHEEEMPQEEEEEEKEASVQIQEEPKKQILEQDQEVEDGDLASTEMEEAAAIFIQAVFRGFMVRSRVKAAESIAISEEIVRGKESPSRFSMGTSVEAQTGNSVDVVSVQEESTHSDKKLQLKLKPQMFKPKEDWDDSTLDSSASKMKVQNRMEAMTRRERALAYAFSQQIRHCSKRKQMKAEETETNMGWSWLERWMATRIPEGSSVEGQLTKQVGTTMRPIIAKKLVDLSFEEKESCGSNEVSVQLQLQMDASQATENKLPLRKSVSRPLKHGPRDHIHTKANRKDSCREAEKDKKQKVKQPECSKKQLSSERSVGDEDVEKSKSDL